LHNKKAEETRNGMNVWGIKSLEERKKGKNNYTGSSSSSSSLTN
jgi:hypothetical protein